MTQTQQNPRSGVALKVALAIAVVVVVALVVTLVLMLRGGGGPNPSAAPTTSATPVSTGTPLVRDDLNVTAGEGGSKKSPIDSKTQIGYAPTCKGAVEAATNYLFDIDPTRVLSGELSKETFLKLVADRTSGDFGKNEVTNMTKGLNEYKGPKTPTQIVKATWGGFSVNKCDQGKSAEIYLIYALSTDNKTFSYVSTATQLQWVDGDWKEVGIADAPTPVELPTQSKGMNQEVLEGVGLHSQWENYTNAGK